MAIITPAPIVLSAGTVKFGTTNNYETSVSSLSLVPTTPTNTFKGIGGNVIPIAGTPAWKANVTAIQDFKTTASFAQWCIANAGTTQAMAYAPVGGTGNTLYTISVVIVPGQIGGAVDTLAEFSVSFDAIGQPVATVL